MQVRPITIPPRISTSRPPTTTSAPARTVERRPTPCWLLPLWVELGVWPVEEDRDTREVLRAIRARAFSFRLLILHLLHLYHFLLIHPRPLPLHLCIGSHWGLTRVEVSILYPACLTSFVSSSSSAALPTFFSSSICYLLIILI